MSTLRTYLFAGSITLTAGCPTHSVVSKMSLDDLVTAEIGPSLSDKVVRIFELGARDVPDELLCKVFTAEIAELNVNLIGPSPQCTTTSRKGRQDLLCEVRQPGSYELRISPAAEGNFVR